MPMCNPCVYVEFHCDVTYQLYKNQAYIAEEKTYTNLKLSTSHPIRAFHILTNELSRGLILSFFLPVFLAWSIIG